MLVEPGTMSTVEGYHVHKYKDVWVAVVGEELLLLLLITTQNLM